jgi:hypothetical protein
MMLSLLLGILIVLDIDLLEAVFDFNGVLK